MLRTETYHVSPTKHQHRPFEQIPPRPPTPPKESPRSKSKVAAQRADEGSVASSREITPPSSSTESASGPPKKRVSWSPWTTYHKPQTIPTTPTTIRLRSSASVDRKSLKGVLKPYSSPLPLSSSPAPAFDLPIVPHTYESFTSMLESVIQALASTERSKKIDTYIAFSSCLRAYDEIPDMHALEERIPVLCSYIRRDLGARMDDGGKPDSQLIQQAIKLMTILSWTPALIEVMDEQSMSFFFQHAIQKVEDPQTSKLSINLYLHFLAQQKYPPSRVVTMERCNRLITALQHLDERVAGKSISKERIDVYNKLLQQSRQIMLSRTPDWMDHPFSGLLSGIKETRERALICMSEVAKTMGNERTVSRTVSSIFGRPSPDGRKMFDSIRQRLEHFVKEGEGIFVARMWAVVLLLVRFSGDKWDFFIPWLRIIEACFNVSDKDVKVQAQAAWAKLIYAMNIGPQSNRKLLELLCKPLEQYLDPRNVVSNTRRPRKAAMVNVCVILYYGFRPNAAWKQLSEIWDVVIVGVVQKLALESKDEVTDGCNILSALFDGSANKIWTENRVLIGTAMRPEEIPRLDPKWVRSNCANVIKTIETALGRSSWQDEDGVQGAKTLWQRFMRTLGDAGSKEIKVSAELMEAVAHLFNLFQRLWHAGPRSLAGPANEDSGPFTQKFTYLVEVTLDSLGPLCFTEKQLAYDEQTKFSAASTPTTSKSTNSSIDGIRHPPILHLFRLLLHPPQDVAVDEDYFSCARTILSKCCNSQDSRRKKLQLLGSCESMLPRRDPDAVDRGMWEVIVELVRTSLPAPPREKALLSPTPSNNELKDAVQVLRWGSQHDVGGWEQLFHELATTVQNELGESSVAGTLIEPVAESLRYQKPDANLVLNLRRCKVLIDRANYVKKRQATDIVSKLQFGFHDHRSTGKDAFVSLYEIVNQFLGAAYDPSNDRTVKSLGMDLFNSTIEFIARASADLTPPLMAMQEGLGMWGADAQHLITQTNGLNPGAATNRWSKLMRAIEGLPKHDTMVLSNLQVLIASGLESRRKGTVDATIRLFNETFGKQDTLGYPKRVKSALRRLRPIADISLPSFPEDTNEDESIPSPPVFSESQDACMGNDMFSSPTPARLAMLDGRRSRTSSPAIVKETPYPVRSNGRRSLAPKATPTRPKHMDSQIEFAPIESGIDEDALDSQVLTEHQKEVKQNQAEAAALFPGLGSSPVSSPVPKSKGQAKRDNRVAAPEATPMGNEDDGEETASGFDSDPEVVQNRSQSVPKTKPCEVSFVSETHVGSPPPTSFTTTTADYSVNSELESPRDSSSPSQSSVVPEGDDLVLQDPSSDNEDDFVDAMEILDGASTPPPDPTDIAVEVSPPKAQYERFVASAEETSDAHSGSSLHRTSPEAQIFAESGRPSRRGRKRKRVPSKSSPEVLDTIVLSKTDEDMADDESKQPESMQSQERPTKKSKETRASARQYPKPSPPKTRSATKYKQPPPKMMALKEDLNRSQKLPVSIMSAEAPPSPTPRLTEADTIHSPAGTPIGTPTPKRRSFISGLSKRITRSSASSSPVKDISFIQETQFDSYPSSIPDSYAPVATSVAPTAGPRAQPLLLVESKSADEMTDEDEPQRESQLAVGTPQPSMSNLQESASSSQLAEGNPQLAAAITQLRALNGIQLPHKQLVEALHAMLDLVDPAVSEMEVDGAAKATEDRIFDSFTMLRKRRSR